MIRLFVGLSLPEDVTRRLALLGGGYSGDLVIGETARYVLSNAPSPWPRTGSMNMQPSNTCCSP